MAELDLGRVVGIDGTNGKDGVNGLSAYANMIVNGYLKDAINQRDKEPENQKYWLDRWVVRTDGDGSEFTYEQGTGVSMVRNGFTCLIQSLGEASKYVGKTLTLVAKVTKNTGGTFEMGFSNSSTSAGVGTALGTKVCTGTGIFTTTVTFTDMANELLNVCIGHMNSGKNTDIICVEWVAVYAGAYTAGNMPDYVPKGYANELLECQRYYIKLPISRQAVYCLSDGVRVSVMLPVPMRITPTLTVVELGSIRCNGGSAIAVTDIAVNKMQGNVLWLDTTHASTSGVASYTGTWNGGEIELSADL